ncbi:nucleobindin-2 isoform X2 [Cloeon dipterum]|uniref:nucleobindin-2 isoform X2 n=1 Tax=Cloeon dipterum TaxID=197152 RepID=UPI00322092DD
MRILVLSLVLVNIVQVVVGPPVTANKKGEADKKDEEQKGADWDIGLEYNRYLQEVVQALESDPEFREKLEKAEVADIRTGKIASELEFVNHNIRSKLDELKRTEMERLRHLAIKEYELKQAEKYENERTHGDGDENEIDHGPKIKLPHHLDHINPHSFEIEDLRKLIVQTTKDLEEADLKRRQEFKEYEMQKEYEKSQQLNLLDEDHRKEFEHKIEEQEEKHKKHPSLHHPGSKQQLEQVWEEQDHMNPEDFNPKTFFHMHDLDGNGYWDADEVKTLFQKELDKMYDPNAPEDDMRERREEMERMREHVFNESDVNRDHLISYEEFLEQTKKKEFEQDQGWQGLDNQKLYTHEEYLEYERKRQEEVQKLIAQGLLPPQPHDMHLPYGIQVPPEYFHHAQQQAGYQQGHQPQLSPHQQPPQGHHQPPHPGQFQQAQGYHPPQPQVVPHNQQPQYQQQQQPQYQQQQPQYQQQQVHYQQQQQPPVHHQQQQQPPVHHQQQPPVHHQQQQQPQYQVNNPPPVQQQFQNPAQQPPVVQHQNNQAPIQQHNNQIPVQQQQQHVNQAQYQNNAQPIPPKQHNSPPLHNQQQPPTGQVHNSPVQHASSSEAQQNAAGSQHN